MKSAKKAKKTKGDVRVAARYGFSVPEKDLMKLLEFDCANELKRLGGTFASNVTPECNNMKSCLLLAAKILSNIQGAWKEVLKEYADLTRLPKGFVPDGLKAAKAAKVKPLLSNEEIGKIRALRKIGMPVKAIGKEIHRAEKTVREFCKTLPY